MSRPLRIPLLVVAAFATACAEAPSLPDTASGPTPDGQAAVLQCTADPAQIRALITQAFSGSGTNANAALGKWDNVVHFMGKRNAGDKDVAKAQDRAYDLVDFLLARNRHRELSISQADLTALINQILCFVGIDGGVTLPDNTWIVHVGDPLVTFITTDGLSGIQFPANAVQQNTIVTASPRSTSAISTLLDKYPHVYDWSLAPSQTLTAGTKAIVGVCPSAAALATVPATELDALLARLVLGHQHTPTDFKPLPRVSIPSQMTLTCGSTSGSLQASLGSRLLRSMAAILLPAEAHAASLRAAIGGVGGSTSEFSAFGPVDPELRGTGGVGGSTSEFIRLGPDGTTSFATAVTGTIDGTVGTQRTGAGLPFVTIHTFQGTPIPGITVAFATAAPATTTPIGDASVCGAATVTDAAGSASVTCVDFGTTLQYRVAYTRLSATMTVPVGLAGSDAQGNPVVTIVPAVQNWLLASYGPSALIFTRPPAGRTVAAGNPYTSNDFVPAEVEVRSDLGEVVPIATGSITLTLPGGEFVGGGSNRVGNAVAGVVTFSVRLFPRMGLRFNATASLSDIGTVQAPPSNLFDIVSP